MIFEMECQYPDEIENTRKIIILIVKMQEILNQFTNQKLKIYLRIPELAFLLKNYIKKELNPKGDSKGYAECYRIIERSEAA